MRQQVVFIQTHSVTQFKSLVSRLVSEGRWRSGNSTRLPPMWPTGFNSRTRRRMWVEFVVDSRPCAERFFSQVLWFSTLLKIPISKFQFDLDYCQALYYGPLVRRLCKHSPCYGHEINYFTFT